MNRIVIADDHPLFREALATAIRRVEPDAEIIERDTLAGARAALMMPGVTDLLLLDLKMPDCEGFAGLVGIRADFPVTPVAVVSASEDASTIRRALAFGASGFIPKSASLEDMGSALLAILAGDDWAPATPVDPEPEGHAMEGRIASLTPSQVRILMGLKKGLLNKQIAFELGVTEATIKAHMTGIFRKLGVMNRTQAVLAARSLRLDG